MAKNYIEEYFISLKLDTNEAKKGLKVLDQYEDKLKAIQKSLAKVKPKVINSDKNDNIPKSLGKPDYDIVQDAIRKRELKEEKALNSRKLSLAKGDYKKKSAFIKQRVSDITNSNNSVLKAMSDFYKKEESLAKKNTTEILKEEKSKALKSKKLLDKVNARKGKLRQQRLADEKDELVKARKSLQDRLKIYKAEKQAEKDLANSSIEATNKRIKADRKLKEQLERRVRKKKTSQSYLNIGEHAPEMKKRFDREYVDAIRKKDSEAIDRISSQVVRANRKMSKSMRSLHLVQDGLRDSTRNMIRSYASLYALWAGNKAIKDIGMNFQAMRIGVEAVTGSASAAKEELSFLREESKRLGFDMVEGSKAYVKLFAAAEGKATKNEIRESFTAIMEAATVFQLSSDDTIGTIKAIQQMFSKTGIMAQELNL